jgi:hypothetical protein
MRHLFFHECVAWVFGDSEKWIVTAEKQELKGRLLRQLQIY